MANEAQLVSRSSPNDITWVTVGDDVAIPEGTLLVFSADPRLCTQHSAANQIAVGWTVEEKLVGDGKTRLGVRTQGYMNVMSDGAITAGDLLEVGATRNRLKTHVAEAFSTGNLAGLCAFALETASGAGERIQVKFKGVAGLL